MIILSILGALGFMALLLLNSSIFTIHTQEAGIVERFGKFVRIAQPGLNFKTPFVETLVYREDLAMQLMDVSVVSKTKDDSTVTIPVRVQYYVLPEKVMEAYYKLDDPARQIQAHVENVILSFIPTLSLDETYQQEGKIAEKIKDALTQVMSAFGYAIENALVTKIIPDDAVVRAMNDINAARRDKIANEAKGESQKILKVKEAEAECEAKILSGKGVAGQRQAIIEGFKESVEDFKQATGMTAEEVTRMLLMTQYFDMMKEIGANSNTIMTNSNPGSINDFLDQMALVVSKGHITAERAAGAAAGKD